MQNRENALIVQGLFNGLLKRPATPDQLEVFTNFLNAGNNVSDLINVIVGGEEYMALSAAKLFVPPGHFYSPIVDTREAAKHLARLKQATTSPLDIHINHEEMVQLWTGLSRYIAQYPFPENVTLPFRYATNNQNYGYGDSSILFAMMLTFKPRRFIEVGSGWSSACALDTSEMFLNGECRFTFIEPYPQLVQELLGEKKREHTIVATPVQDVNLSTFDDLESGDILFIDSTHVVRTGSDVCFELFEILPRLKSGVIVHIHDMFWPFEYPDAWVIDENRSWNELYLVRALLMNSDAWNVIYFNDYFAARETERLSKECPRILQNPGGGLWLRKN